MESEDSATSKSRKRGESPVDDDSEVLEAALRRVAEKREELKQDPRVMSFGVFRKTLETVHDPWYENDYEAFVKVFNKADFDDVGSRLEYQPFELGDRSTPELGHFTIYWVNGCFFGVEGRFPTDDAARAAMLKLGLKGLPQHFEVTCLLSNRAYALGGGILQSIPRATLFGHITVDLQKGIDDDIVKVLTPNITCGNCDRHGHGALICRKLTPEGDLAACSLCNTKAHLFDDCARAASMSPAELFHVLIEARAHNGPIRSAKLDWVQVALAAKKVDDYPWTRAHAKKWLREDGEPSGRRDDESALGPNADLWREYDYIRGFPKMYYDPETKRKAFLDGLSELYVDPEKQQACPELWPSPEAFLSKQIRELEKEKYRLRKQQLEKLLKQGEELDAKIEQLEERGPEADKWMKEHQKKMEEAEEW